MSDDITFVDGLIVKRGENAPDYVLCNLSVKVNELVPWLEQHQSNGWVNVVCKVSKAGKHYAQLDTWKPTQGDSAKQGMATVRAAVQSHSSTLPEENIATGVGSFDDDIPFSNYELKVHW